jgi:hypothetical protein
MTAGDKGSENKKEVNCRQTPRKIKITRSSI